MNRALFSHPDKCPETMLWSARGIDPENCPGRSTTEMLCLQLDEATCAVCIVNIMIYAINEWRWGQCLLEEALKSFHTLLSSHSSKGVKRACCCYSSSAPAYKHIWRTTNTTSNEFAITYLETWIRWKAIPFQKPARFYHQVRKHLITYNISANG